MRAAVARHCAGRLAATRGAAARVVAALLALAFAGQSAYADSPWSDPITVFSTSGRATRPVITADVQGDTHLFFAAAETRSAQVEPPRAIMYARLHDEQWSAPVTILSMPDGGAMNFPAATVDGAGLLHVVWQGGSLQRIHYSRAPVEAAGTAQGWTAPRVLSIGGAFDGGLGSDIVSGGGLHLLYASQDGDVYHRRSLDAGTNWSAPLRLSQVGREEASDYPRLAVDANGGLHAAWTQLRRPAGWPPSGGYYSRSVDGGQTWTAPRLMIGKDHGSGGIAAMADGRVHLVWNSVGTIGERLHQWSADGGVQWSEPQTIPLQFSGGFTGYPALAADATNTLHLVTGVTGAAGKHGEMYYAAWDGGVWSRDVLISQGAIGRRAVERPSAALSGGNRLRVVYDDDTERIWFTTRTTAAPALSPQPFAKREIGRRPDWWIQWALATLALLLIVSRAARGLAARRRSAG